MKLTIFIIFSVLFVISFADEPTPGQEGDGNKKPCGGNDNKNPFQQYVDSVFGYFQELLNPKNNEKQQKFGKQAGGSGGGFGPFPFPPSYPGFPSFPPGFPPSYKPPQFPPNFIPQFPPYRPPPVKALDDNTNDNNGNYEEVRKKVEELLNLAGEYKDKIQNGNNNNKNE